MNNDNLFNLKLKSIHNNINTSKNEKDINEELDLLYDFIQSKYNDLEFFKKLDEIINEILNPEAIKNEYYAEGFVKKYLNIYFQKLKTDVYASWGLLFYKILCKKVNLEYSLIYSSIIKIYFKYLDIEYSINDISFPISSEVKLFYIIDKFSPIFENLIIDSSSYNLLFNPLFRNKIILYLYDFYKKNSNLKIWFPCSGIGTEPLLFSLLLNLINELESNQDKMKNFKIFCSDANDILLEEGLRINPLNDLLLKTKSDFAGENNKNEKNIKTTIINSKKNLIIKKNDFLNTGKYIDEIFDVLIINSLKLSDINFFNKKIIKRFNKLNEINRDIIIILEIKTIEKIDENNFSLNGYKPIAIIDSSFISEKNIDYFLSYLIFEIKTQKDMKIDENDYSLANFYKKYDLISQKELKQAILKIDKNSIKTNKDNLIYAYLLAKASLFNKAYDITKNNYSTDYNFSFKILKTIIENCKNSKITKKVENFIEENEIKEKGFTSELFDAMIDGIEEYEIEEKKYDNKKKWL